MKFTNLISCGLLAACGLCLILRGEEGSKVDVYSAKEITGMAQQLLQKRSQFASQDLARYGNHYLMLAQREATGSAEVHEREADIFIVENGNAVLVTGGKLVNPHTQKAGEIRGSAIEGGQKQTVAEGDIIHIPAGTPHQLLLETGKPFTYFVVKVTGQ
jgi:mannose-6-phosphate isomerase-like protein (cupin superfamily)